MPPDPASADAPPAAASLPWLPPRKSDDRPLAPPPAAAAAGPPAAAPLDAAAPAPDDPDSAALKKPPEDAGSEDAPLKPPALPPGASRPAAGRPRPRPDKPEPEPPLAAAAPDGSTVLLTPLPIAIPPLPLLPLPLPVKLPAPPALLPLPLRRASCMKPRTVGEVDSRPDGPPLPPLAPAGARRAAFSIQVRAGAEETPTSRAFKRSVFASAKEKAAGDDSGKLKSSIPRSRAAGARRLPIKGAAGIARSSADPVPLRPLTPRAALGIEIGADGPLVDLPDGIGMPLMTLLPQ